MTDKERVKSWRVLRDGLRQGVSVRNFGDFLPEAPTLPTFRTLLNTDIIEEVWVDKEEFESWEKSQKERDEAIAAGIDLDDVDDDVDEEDENEKPTPAPSVKTPRKTTKKIAAKKTAKKTVKKGKTSGEAKQLSAQRV